MEKQSRSHHQQVCVIKVKSKKHFKKILNDSNRLASWTFESINSVISLCQIQCLRRRVLRLLPQQLSKVTKGTNQRATWTQQRRESNSQHRPMLEQVGYSSNIPILFLVYPASSVLQSAQLSLQWPENVCSGFFSRRRAPTAPCHRADRGGSPQSQNRRSADERYHRGPVFTVLHRHAGEQCQCHQMFISSVQSRLKSEWIAYFLIQEKKLSSVTETN